MVAVDSSDIKVLVGLMIMEKAKKRGMLEQLHKEVNLQKFEDDVISWASAENFDQKIPKVIPREYWIQIFEGQDQMVAIPRDCGDF